MSKEKLNVGHYVAVADRAKCLMEALYTVLMDHVATVNNTDWQVKLAQAKDLIGEVAAEAHKKTLPDKQNPKQIENNKIHGLLDRADWLNEIFCDLLVEDIFIQGKPKIRNKAENASSLIGSVYQDLGEYVD